jgi:hypothetical protein
MNWLLTDKEMDAVLALDAPTRYGHWIKKVVDEENVWVSAAVPLTLTLSHPPFGRGRGNRTK